MAQPFPGPQAPSAPSFDELYAVARAHLSERLPLLRVPPEDVDDVIHEVVLIAHAKLDEFRPTTVDPAEPPDPWYAMKAWLSVIAWRLVSRTRRAAWRRRELPGNDRAVRGACEAGVAPSSEQLAAERQRRALLLWVLDKLKPERAEVLVMHAFFEMPVPEIAGELGVNENTVKSRIGRARQDAKALMKRLSPDEQSVLQGSPLLFLFAPFALDMRWEGQAEETPTQPRQTVRGSPVALLGSVLALGIAIGMGLKGHPRRDLDALEIAEAREALPVLSVAPAATVAALPVVFGAPSAAAPPAGALSPAPPGDKTKRERALLQAARRAVRAHAYDRAIELLQIFDREFPRGALSAERALLEQETARGRDGTNLVR